MTPPSLALSRDAFGQLRFVDASGETHLGVLPVRAFPISAPDSGIALLNVEGRELVWFDKLDALPAETAELIREELARREFVPEIQAIRGVSSFACPSTWTIVTDRGESTLVLKGEEDIRRLAGDRLLIADTHGIQFLVRDLKALDRESRKFLDRFL